METPKKEPETLPAPNAEVLEDVSQDDLISTASKNHHMEGILRRKIRLKIKTKLEIRARNGEISSSAVTDLEEELVNELEKELFEDLEGELGWKRT